MTIHAMFRMISIAPRYGSFYNDAWREYRGKLVFEF